MDHANTEDIVVIDLRRRQLFSSRSYTKADVVPTFLRSMSHSEARTL